MLWRSKSAAFGLRVGLIILAVCGFIELARVLFKLVVSIMQRGI